MRIGKEALLKSVRRTLSLWLIMAMFLSLAPWDEVARSIAVNVGGTSTVSSVRFVKVHSGFENLSSYMEIRGTDLDNVQILFSQLGIGYEEAGTKTISTETFLKYVFTKAESDLLDGRLIVGNKEITVSLASFPIFTGASTKSYNIQDPALTGLELYGNNLDHINDAGVVAEYGRSITQPFTYNAGGGDTSAKVIIENPTPVSGLGYQSLRLSRTGVAPEAADVTTTVAFEYANAFRLVENVGLTGLEMYPNTGAKGDYIYLTATDFNDQKDYQVYFQKVGEGGADYTATNKGTKVSLQLNIDGTTSDKLTIKVPEATGFQEGVNYNVIVTVVQNNEVIAEQYVKKLGVNEEFKVIQAGYRSTIDQVSPESGPDTGSDVVITGKNLLTLDLPGLTGTGNITSVTGANGDKELIITYDDGTFDGRPVSITRKVSTVIGKEAIFQKVGLLFDYIKGDANSVPDRFTVQTQGIDDVATDPQKDVVVETETVMTATDGSGKVYTFNQAATKINAYLFLASSIAPTITEIIPDQIHVEVTGTTHKLKHDTQLVIKGTDFTVYKKVNPDGTVELKKPTIFIKGVASISEQQYQIGLFPNLNGGTIKYKTADGDLDATATVITGKLNMTVLNDKGEVVDGTVGNEIGTKIIVRIPNEVQIKVANVKKNLQVTNPRRGSDNYGDAAIKYDSVEFITTNDYPIIETVAPSVVSVDGNVEIVVRGTNFQPGLTVLLDGETISPVTREVDTAGNKINLKFKAPKGREGVTQLQILNPSGGLAVWDFVYVKSFNKDPEIESFSPPRGIAGTLVSVNGDNFLKPDPTAPTNIGFDANRLIGTKIYLDGKDVNEYNFDGNGNLAFVNYTAANPEKIIDVEFGKGTYSKFYKNSYLYKDDANQNRYFFDRDAAFHPVITNYDEEYYILKYNAATGEYETYNKAGVLLGEALITEAAGTTTITIDNAGTPLVFKAVMDNQILRKSKSSDGSMVAESADYADAMILEDRTIPASKVFYTLNKDYGGNIRLTNGKDKVFTVTYDSGTDKFWAKPDNGGTTLEVVPMADRILLDGVPLYLTSPYKKDADGYIFGLRTKVISKDQILFTVPSLATGTGYKDLAAVNPDTKEALKKGNEGFYYISQSGTHPLITGIEPASGSIDGGYSVKITGVDFEDNMKVYVDGQLVPAKDTFVAIDGKSVTVVMPKTIKRLKEDYGVEKMAVPVVVLNEDGGADHRPDGFTYVIPSSKPLISKIIDVKGSSNGNEIVEISGSDFRFFEPYKDEVGAPGYTAPILTPPTSPGDPFSDINKNNVWDDYLLYQDKAKEYIRTLDPALKFYYDEYEALKTAYALHPLYNYYFKSKTMPRIFFGNVEAKIVEYGKGYIRVVTPPQAAGKVSVYVINNDSGISNKVDYTYESSQPKITSIVPNIGTKMGQETKEVFGTTLYQSIVKGYFNFIETAPPVANDATTIDADEVGTLREIPNVQAIVRFADIDNRKIDRNSPNSGLINNGRSTVNLSGGLTMEYISEADGSVTLRATIQEGGKIYTRNFANYDNTSVFLPMEMLKAADGDFYAPTGYLRADPKAYTNAVFEYVRVSVEDRRMMVERGYAPKVTYNNSSNVTVTTPSYYTINVVDMTFSNPDGGKATAKFEYTNPASKPKIYEVKPAKLSDDGTYYYLEGSVKGGWEIEIRGEDFRDGVKVAVNNKAAEIVEITKIKLPDADNPTGPEKEYDNLIVKVPPGTDIEVDQKFTIFLENTDRGLANSATIANLIGPNKNKPIYLIYRKPLSLPKITAVTPGETSAAGNRTLIITGTDFRAGATVTLGSKNGLPLPIVSIDPKGIRITVTTPPNVTLGDKSITVTNSDYGSDTLDNAVTVISNPILFGQIYADDGKTVVTNISLEGGETLTLKGQNFDKGAKVFFGGNYIKETAATPTGDYGLNSVDEWWKVEKGVAGASVEFIDSQTLKVKTPERLTEGKIIVTIINGDKGITDGMTELIYKVPVPSTPANLKAEVVSNQYIRLYDYTSKNVDYYEVYYYIGDKTESQLKVGQYKDFAYLNNTETEPYKITRLPGYEKLRDKQVVYFVIKAVNKFGPSNYSNIAFISYEVLKNVPAIGPKDTDGGLGVPEGKQYTHQPKGTQSIVNLAGKITADPLRITIPTAEAKGLVVRFINVPEQAVTDSRATVIVSYGDSVVQFLPQVLNTDPFRRMAFDDDAYGRLVTQPINNSYAAALKSDIPRTLKAVSGIFTVAPYAVNNATALKASTFNGAVDFGIAYDTTKVTAAQEKNVKLYYYDSGSGNWVAVKSTTDTGKNIVYGRLTKAGEYLLMVGK